MLRNNISHNTGIPNQILRLTVAILATIATLIVFESDADAAGQQAPQPATLVSSIVISDTFAGPHGTLVSHAPDVDTVGEGWKTFNGEWIIGQGRAYDNLGQNTPLFTTINPSASNYTVSLDVTWLGGSDAGLVFRHIDDENYLSAVFTGKHLELRKTSNGVTSTLQRSPITWAKNDTKTIVVTVDGINMEATVEGTTISSRSSLFEFGRSVGALVQRTQDVQFKEIEVRAIGPQVTPPPITFPSVGTAVLFDSFTGTSSLSAHTPDVSPAGGWVEQNGTWDVSDGSVSEVTAAIGDHRALIDTTIADTDIYAKINWNGGGAGIIYRWLDPSNFWMTWTDGNLLFTASIDPTDGFVLRDVTRHDWGPPGTERTLRVRVNGLGIRVYIEYEDIPIVRIVSDLSVGATKVGLFSKKSIGNTFDEFAVIQSGVISPPDVIPTFPPQIENPDVPPTPAGATVFDSFSGFPFVWHGFHDPNEAPEFRKWEVNEGAWYTDFDQLTEVRGALSDQRAVINSGVEDSLIEAKFLWENGRVGLAFRYRDEKNHALAWYDGFGNLAVGKLVQGEFILLGQFEKDILPGKTMRMKIWIEDDEAVVMVDNEFLGAFDVSELPNSTGVGLFSRNVQTARFDNLTLTPSATQPEPGGLTLTPVVEDTFSTTGPIDLDSSIHSPDLQATAEGWIEHSGNWSIDSGVVRETFESNADHRAAIQAVPGDQLVSVDLTYNGGRAGITYHYTDENNWYMFWYDGVNLIFGKNVTGTYSTVAIRQIEWGPLGTTRTLSVLDVGGEFTGFIDGTDVISASGQTELSGGSRAGLFARSQPSGTVFDNFTVESVGP